MLGDVLGGITLILLLCVAFRATSETASAAYFLICFVHIGLWMQWRERRGEEMR